MAVILGGAGILLYCCTHQTQRWVSNLSQNNPVFFYDNTGYFMKFV